MELVSLSLAPETSENLTSVPPEIIKKPLKSLKVLKQSSYTEYFKFSVVSRFSLTI